MIRSRLEYLLESPVMLVMTTMIVAILFYLSSEIIFLDRNITRFSSSEAPVQTPVQINKHLSADKKISAQLNAPGFAAGRPTAQQQTEAISIQEEPRRSSQYKKTRQKNKLADISEENSQKDAVETEFSSNQATESDISTNESSDSNNETTYISINTISNTSETTESVEETEVQQEPTLTIADIIKKAQEPVIKTPAQEALVFKDLQAKVAIDLDETQEIICRQSAEHGGRPCNCTLTVTKIGYRPEIRPLNFCE